MRILFLTHRLPYAPNRGDRVRAYHLLRHMAGWAEVDLVSLVHDDEEQRQVGELQGMAARVRVARVPRTRNLLRGVASLPGPVPLTHRLLDAPGVDGAIAELVASEPPSAVLAYCSGMARYALGETLRPYPLILDMVDVDSAKWAALAGTSAFPRSWVYRREARLLSRFEALAANRARLTLVTTARERDTLHELAPTARVEVIENGVADDLTPTGPPVSEPVVVFCGVMDYAPNVEAVSWFVKDVWPSVRRQVPGARFHIVGARPSSSVRRLAADDVVVTGSVPDVRPYLWRAAVAVAPITTARGVQNKVLEAVAAGLPVVLTPQVIRGVPAALHSACRQADTAEAFGGALVDLLRAAPAYRRKLVESADQRGLSWPSRLSSLRSMVESAVKPNSATRRLS